MRHMSLLQVFRLGGELQRYSAFLKVQKQLHELRRAAEIPDTLVTLQYHPVYTVGKRGHEQHFLRPIEELRSEGFDVEWIDRGGEVTYHGPGQLVMYPVVHLREKRLGARLFVEKLENVMIRLAACYGLHATGQIKDRTGVWINEKKIGAIGVRISSGISSHGIAFNVRADLRHYTNIVPCGLDYKVCTLQWICPSNGFVQNVTNLDAEVGSASQLEDVEANLIDSFVQEFDYETQTRPSHSEWMFLTQSTRHC